MPTRKPKPDDPAQYNRFVELAREVEADEAPDAMDRAFERVIQPSQRNADAPPKQPGGDQAKA